MEISEIDILEGYEVSKRAFFIAGIVKIQTEIPLEVIMKFINSVYSSGLSPGILIQIEKELIAGKIGSAKEILEVNTSTCMICNLKATNTISLRCQHVFHRDCILASFRDQAKKNDDILCTVCGQVVSNIEEIDKEVYMQNNDYKLSRILSQPNITKCPTCNEIFQFDEADIVTCPICSYCFCSSCRNLGEACTCEKYCFLCQNGNRGYMCQQCQVKYQE